MSSKEEALASHGVRIVDPRAASLLWRVLTVMSIMIMVLAAAVIALWVKLGDVSQDLSRNRATTCAGLVAVHAHLPEPCHDPDVLRYYDPSAGG